MKNFLAAVFTLLLGSACSFKHQPCADGGDVSWEPAIVGTMECFQKTLGGTKVNQGRFRQWHTDGKIALEGAFIDGKRDGVWSYYDANGEKKMEKNYEKGVEKAFVRPAPKDAENSVRQ